MAEVDFTEQLRVMEEKDAKIAAKYPPKYHRVNSGDVIPGIDLELYVNVKNQDDIYFAPASACVVLGLSRGWLNTAYTRPTTMAMLIDRGFNPEKRFVAVLSGGKAGKLSKPCLAIDRADFDALTDYAAEIAEKKEAKILRNAFMLLGLVSVAGLSDTAASDRAAFINLYNQCKREMENA